MFDRDLPDDLVAILNRSPFWANICEDRELHPEIRRRCITVYYKGRGLIRDMQVRVGVLTGQVHWKYVPTQQPTNDDYVDLVSQTCGLEFVSPVLPRSPGLCTREILKDYKHQMDGARSFPESDLIQKIICREENQVLDQEIAFQDQDTPQQTLKDPYVFDFLTLAEEARERDLERGLLEHLRDFILELGVGFAFVGSQYHLEVDGKDYYIDLLFYHLKLRAFAVIDLKVEEFKPEFAGKMSFYLSAVDDLLRHPDDQSSIGIILCKSRGKVTVEYALRDTHKPIGVSEYRLTDALPQELKPSLPTIEELEEELSRTPSAI